MDIMNICTGHVIYYWQLLICYWSDTVIHIHKLRMQPLRVTCIPFINNIIMLNKAGLYVKRVCKSETISDFFYVYIKMALSAGSIC